MISVVIPTYNAAQFIAEAISSVLGQTYTDFEVIVIDDGSIDNTSDIISNQFQNIGYFRIPNQGASKARNYGIQRARGEFVAFLDADDLWLPEKLEKQLDAFRRDPDLMMVFTDNRVFDSDGVKEPPFLKSERLMKGDVVRNIFLYSRVTTSTVMVRKKVFDEVGLFEEGLKVAEDDNLWMRIALRYRIGLVDEVLVHYRNTENSLSRSPDKLFGGALKNVELIERKYPDLERRLGRPLIRRKKSDIYSSWGYHHFSGGDHGAARRLYWRSFVCYPRIRSAIYCFMSIFPRPIVEHVRSAMR